MNGMKALPSRFGPRLARIPRRLRRVALLLACIWCGAAKVAAACTGDCDGSAEVTINEIVTMVGMALEQGGSCAAGDRDGDGRITIDEILQAVQHSLMGCPPAPTATPQPTPTPEPQCGQHNPQRNLYFGDLHVHTIHSFDAYLWDTRTTPVDAYRFARGETILLPPLDANGVGTRPLRLERPLDFAAVTDHSEFLGEIETCITPGTAGYDSPSCALVRSASPQIYADLGARLTSRAPRRFTDICGSDGSGCRDAAGTVWQRIQAAAAQANDPCGFTALLAYEYSRSPGASTMHRNVIFRTENVPFPISGFEQPTPLGLWNELRASCIDAANDCDVLAIPHNSNESNGRMFEIEYGGVSSPQEQRALAALRARMEPLVEVYQHKGSSECLSGVSGILGNDEDCDFEPARVAPFEDCGDGTGQLGAAGGGCISRNDFARYALFGGLQEQLRLGVNPLQVGFIGSTDTHSGTAGATDERTFAGHQGTNDADPVVLLGGGDFAAAGIIASPGGLAAVWAQENMRASLFDALRRRETFATSGTRLAVRTFGGWHFPENLCASGDLVEQGYALGVPMGGVLGERPADAAPSFVVSALRDAGSEAHPGTRLQRVQIIKGWIAGGERHQQVYDVAGSDNAADVDLETCTPRGPGADSLCGVWRDPSFDPSVPAFYTVRVLENPSCRWSTWVCNSLPPQSRPSTCSDPAVPKTIQERAWTSPIWYVPH